MENNRVKLAILSGNGEDCREGIVQGIGFDDNRSVWDPVSKYWGSGECFFEYVEGFAGLLGELIRDPLTSEMSERDHNIRVVENKTSIEIGEAEEGLMAHQSLLLLGSGLPHSSVMVRASKRFCN